MKRKGYTIFEIMLVIIIIMISLVMVTYLVNPVKNQEKARDNRRLSDLSNLDRAINEFRGNHGHYPGTKEIFYKSTTLPQGAISLQDISNGWVGGDLSGLMMAKLPLDPKNDTAFFYSYYHDDHSYELNCVLENLTTEMQNDGGNDTQKYEMGNNLLLISP